jgi:hypothetical protein
MPFLRFCDLSTSIKTLGWRRHRENRILSIFFFCFTFHTSASGEREHNTQKCSQISMENINRTCILTIWYGA